MLTFLYSFAHYYTISTSLISTLLSFMCDFFSPSHNLYNTDALLYIRFWMEIILNALATLLKVNVGHSFRKFSGGQVILFKMSHGLSVWVSISELINLSLK